MADSRDKPELETLSYEPECECLDCKSNYGIGKKPIEQSANLSPAIMGFNSVVIKPETRVNNKEVVEQPNQNINIMIIEQIEGLMSQVNEKLDKLQPIADVSDIALIGRKEKKGRAIEEIDLFQKTTLFDLRKAFE